MNNNMFAETVYVQDLLASLATLGKSFSIEFTIQGKMMTALRQSWSN
jgi:hypothetical protein